MESALFVSVGEGLGTADAAAAFAFLKVEDGGDRKRIVGCGGVEGLGGFALGIGGSEAWLDWAVIVGHVLEELDLGVNTGFRCRR